jgi:hypothetical protein
VTILTSHFNRRIFVFGLAWIAFLLAFCSPVTNAQTSRVAAAVAGTVRDTTNGVIVGASVMLRNLSTNQTRTVLTDSEGSFGAQALPVGPYETRVDQPGFAPYKQAEFDLFLGQTARLDIILAPASASASEQMTVTAQADSVDTTQTSVVSTVDGKRIEELPVESRNARDKRGMSSSWRLRY